MTSSTENLSPAELLRVSRASLETSLEWLPENPACSYAHEICRHSIKVSSDLNVDIMREDIARRISETIHHIANFLDQLVTQLVEDDDLNNCQIEAPLVGLHKRLRDILVEADVDEDHPSRMRHQAYSEQSQVSSADHLRGAHGDNSSTQVSNLSSILNHNLSKYTYDVGQNVNNTRTVLLPKTSAPASTSDLLVLMDRLDRKVDIAFTNRDCSESTVKHHANSGNRSMIRFTD